MKNLILPLLAVAEAASHECSYTPPRLSRLAGSPSCPDPFIPHDDPSARAIPWAPWTHQPFCANSSYCLYTNAAFHDGIGFSIIDTPEMVASSQHILEKAFTARVHPLVSSAGENAASPPYEVAEIPGKGKGVVAKRHISCGEIFMVDYASVVAAVSFPGRVKEAQGKQLFARSIDQLPDPTEILELSTSTVAKGTPVVEDIIRTNTFGVEIGGESYMGLFPLVSRINHACNPNAYTRFSETTLSQNVIAFRDIEPGEEITISYSTFGLTHAERQQTLLQRWGFRCTCPMCTSAAAEIAASDARRRRAKSMRDEILDRVNKGQYREAIVHTKQLMEINEREGLVSHLGDHYEMLARLYVGAMDLDNAEKYARLALGDMRRFGGEDVFDSMRELEGLLGRLERRGGVVKGKTA